MSRLCQVYFVHQGKTIHGLTCFFQLISFILSKFFDLELFYVYECFVCIYVCMPYVCELQMKFKRDGWMPWN